VHSARVFALFGTEIESDCRLAPSTGESYPRTSPYHVECVGHAFAHSKVKLPGAGDEIRERIELHSPPESTKDCACQRNATSSFAVRIPLAGDFNNL
jgi:hypothetical protein